MNDAIKIFFSGFIKGFKETPRMYFAPMTAMFKAVYEQATETEDESDKNDKNKAA